MKTKGKRILVVDDEPPIQRILRRNLTMSGYDVLIAENGEQAIDFVRLHQPDLILLDLWLPGEMDGMSVCMQVRQWTQVPIIVVSARTDEKQKVQALDMGADDYLRVYVRQLRVKIEEKPSQPKYILTEPGVGYVFRPQVMAESLGETQTAISTTMAIEMETN